MKKPCRECIHCKSEEHPLLNNEDFDKCKIAKHWSYCFLQREDWFVISLIMKTCGKRGRWFKAKPPKPTLEEVLIKILTEAKRVNNERR